MEPFRAEVKTRYSAREASAEVTPMAHAQASVHFNLPQRDITPGQAAVFYADNVVLGGGIIV
jgi:tRNA-specific 2-thiouridylase